MNAAAQPAPVRERPVLFSAPMVRAILAGTKTQTRRVIDVAPTATLVAQAFDPHEVVWDLGHHKAATTPVRFHVGTRLWVKEAWQYADWTEDGRPFIRYRADDAKILRERIPSDWAERLTDTWAELSDSKNFDIDKRAADRKWRPSIFMPRWASRIDLEITEVRVQRIQDISEEDALAEGVDRAASQCPCEVCARTSQMCPATASGVLEDFRSLWDSINGEGSWALNPWCWAITFKRVRP